MQVDFMRMLELTETIRRDLGMDLSDHLKWEKEATDSLKRALGLSQDRETVLNQNTHQNEPILDLNTQIDEPVESQTCCVCYDKSPEVYLVPCGHNNLCEACAQRCRRLPLTYGGGRCPNCRVRIERIQRMVPL